MPDHIHMLVSIPPKLAVAEDVYKRQIQSLGDQLKPVAMLSMLEYINTCVMSNERNDPKAATWVLSLIHI